MILWLDYLSSLADYRCLWHGFRYSRLNFATGGGEIVPQAVAQLETSLLSIG